MRRLLFCIALVALLLVIAPAASAREWTDTTGGFSVEAELVEVKDDKVRLKKSNGQIVAVPIAKLSKGDREYIASLVKTKGKPDDEKQKEAVYQGKTISQWVEVLKHEGNSARRAAIALGKIGPDAVPALIEALKDKDKEVHRLAVYALGQIGPAAKDAVPALKALSETEPSVRRSVAKALKQIEK